MNDGRAASSDRPTSAQDAGPMRAWFIGAHAPASAYALLSQLTTSASTSLGDVSRTSWCQRFFETCSCARTRGLLIGFSLRMVRSSHAFFGCAPANPVSRTKWIEVFLGSALTGPTLARLESTLS